jgi:small subunit ribosomal protein S7
LERDEESKEKAPGVIKEDMDKTRDAVEHTSFANLMALGQMEAIATGGHASDVETPGHLFELPNLPLPSTSNLKHRYDPVVEQVTKLIMRHGKLSVAQRVSLSILSFPIPSSANAAELPEHVYDTEPPANFLSPKPQPLPTSPPRVTSGIATSSQSCYVSHSCD